MIKNKSVVLGVTGGVAAYKAVDLASRLARQGARVNVIMTRSAQEFVGPMSFRAITGQPVVTDMFDVNSEFSAAHIALAARADVVVIAPATANIMAKLACGIADDMLSTTVLATRAPVIIAPAMHANMYENQVTQENVAKLKARGFTFVGPVYGLLTGDAKGLGRFADVEDIIGTVRQVLGRSADLAGRRIVVSAGGTREPIDPARHMSNRSSGKMGHAVAEAARDRGAQVVLVTAPTALRPPAGVEVVQVETTIEMRDAVVQAAATADALIMAAAPADFRPASRAESKIKRTSERITLELVENPDILAEVTANCIRVGFAAESDHIVENAAKKAKKKNLDLIAANDITATDSGFDVDTNKVTLIDREGKVEELPLLSKYEVANRILDRVAALLTQQA